MILRNHRLIYDQLQETAPRARPWIIDHASAAVPVIDDQVDLSDVADAAARTATLFESLGIEPGDYCAVWLDAPIDIAIIVAALTAVGGIPILLSPKLDADTVASMVEPVPVERIVTTGDRRAACAEIQPFERIHEWAALAAELPVTRPRRTCAVAMPSTSPYVVTHTSGTTGVPKLVQYTRQATDNQGYAQEFMAPLGAPTQPVAVAVSPVHFRAVSGLLCALRRNVRLMVLADESPRSVGRLVRRWKPIFLEAHPNTFMDWESLARNGSFASVRYFVSTFDVIHPRTVRRMLAGSKHRFAILLEAYGQSELGGSVGTVHVKGLVDLIGLLPIPVKKLLEGHSVGWAAPGYASTRIVGPDGAEVPAGTPGRIQVRSAGQFQTYINRPEAASANLSSDGWWDTGDYGKKTRFGELILMDRQVERMSLIPSGIAMEDVLLSRLPWLAEVIVLEHDDRVVPVVAVREGHRFDEKAWRRAVSGLPKLSLPIVFDIHDLPRTATGKVQRARLTALISRQSR
ncbi:class I adenylate-forming enzyme family protein [Nocardia pseudobrasiliensis]|uniref:Acyl-CoA synthetase (AMP-forming)/AMP-acid ligase II n=1 Tax=Nocardia pseudobrasiliensis TaxID=45979 RepID=A0A370I321_9NOCA|nr:class I adenylate-forming enzyme family protein [Nocardia pseudobrasiliensis]RDI65139.1 acyl-CoA synthetase (AMP-forming)/AMP-acid ligase II [Nocardia pseudobrasiliensis]